MKDKLNQILLSKQIKENRDTIQKRIDFLDRIKEELEELKEEER